MGTYQWAIEQQRQWAKGFASEGFPDHPRWIGGADVGFCPEKAPRRTGSVGSRAVAVALVWDLQQRQCVEVRGAYGQVTMPYIPGLLSFREAPLLLQAIEKLTLAVDLWIFDGQGICHPRGVGLATHMGMVLQKPAVGVAKSRLCGEAQEPSVQPGAHEPIWLGGQVVGEVLQTGLGLLYISPGYRATVCQSLEIVQGSLTGHPLPEPTYWADYWTHQWRSGGSLTDKAMA